VQKEVHQLERRAASETMKRGERGGGAGGGGSGIEYGHRMKKTTRDDFMKIDFVPYDQYVTIILPFFFCSS